MSAPGDTAQGERGAGEGLLRFRYSDQVLARFPGVCGGVLLAGSLRNGPSTAGLIEGFRTEQARVLQRVGAQPLAEVPALAAWRRAFADFGVKPTQYRNAAEALLRRLTKKGSLPEVNLLTDLGNLVSIRYALPVAVLDTRRIAGAITVCLARGDEAFTELDSAEVRHPEPGEVIFVDERSTVHARRWCWRQSAQTGAREDTSEVLVTVEGHHPGAVADVPAALEDLEALLREYAGATVAKAVLSPAAPEFRAP